MERIDERRRTVTPSFIHPGLGHRVEHLGRESGEFGGPGRGVVENLSHQPLIVPCLCPTGFPSGAIDYSWKHADSRIILPSNGAVVRPAAKSVRRIPVRRFSGQGACVVEPSGAR